MSPALHAAWLVLYFLYFVGIIGAAVAAKVFPTRSARRTRDIGCTVAVFLAQAETCWLLFGLPLALRHSAVAHTVLQVSFAVTACVLMARLLIGMRVPPSPAVEVLGNADEVFQSLDRTREREKRIRIGDTVAVVSRSQFTIPAASRPQLIAHTLLVMASALGTAYILTQLNILYGKIWMSGGPSIILWLLVTSPVRTLYDMRRRGSVWVAKTGLFVNGTNIGTPSAAVIRLAPIDAGMSVTLHPSSNDTNPEQLAIFENAADAEQVVTLLNVFLQQAAVPPSTVSAR